MKVTLCYGLIFLLLCTPSFAKRSRDKYAYACNGQSFTLEDSSELLSFKSPDGRKVIQLTKEFDLALVIEGVKVKKLSLTNMSCCGEVVWSPDSRQFSYSYSDGGAYGRYTVHLYTIKGSQVLENKLVHAVYEKFKRKHYCVPRGNNIFFLGWTRDSKRVFLVTEAFPTSDCGKDLSKFAGYLVDSGPGTIVETFNESRTEAIKKSCYETGVVDIESLDNRRTSKPSHSRNMQSP
jgi:hypothetical protein